MIGFMVANALSGNRTSQALLPPLRSGTPCPRGRRRKPCRAVLRRAAGQQFQFVKLVWQEQQLELVLDPQRSYRQPGYLETGPAERDRAEQCGGGSGGAVLGRGRGAALILLFTLDHQQLFLIIDRFPQRLRLNRTLDLQFELLICVVWRCRSARIGATRPNRSGFRS